MNWAQYHKTQIENPVIKDWAESHIDYPELSKKYKISIGRIKSITNEAMLKTHFPLKLESDVFVVKMYNKKFAQAMQRLNLKTFEELLKYPFKELSHKVPAMGEKTLWSLLLEANKLGVQPNTEGYKPK